MCIEASLNAFPMAVQYHPGESRCQNPNAVYYTTAQLSRRPVCIAMNHKELAFVPVGANLNHLGVHFPGGQLYQCSTTPCID